MSDHQRAASDEPPPEQLADSGPGSDGNPLSDEASSSQNVSSSRSGSSNTYIFPIRSVYNNRAIGPGGPTSPKLGSPPAELHRILSRQGNDSPSPQTEPQSMFDMLETTSAAGKSSTATLSRRPMVSPNLAGSQSPETSTVPSPPAPPRPVIKKNSSGASERGKTRLEPDDAGMPALVNDFSTIVRLGDASQVGTTTVEGSSTALPPTTAPAVTRGAPPLTSNEPGQASLGGLMRKAANPTASASMRAQTRDNVRNFVNEQAHTVQMADPNAATPSPGPDAADTSSIDSSLSSSQPSLSGGESQSSTRGSRDIYVPRPVAANRWRPFGDTVSDEQSNVQSDQLEHSGRGSSMGNIAPEEPFTTFRFQHLDTEEGHHVITGREGKLERCEDEPITIPGAVQGFGVLVLLEEDLDTGDLTVRQVSENSTELLGLSPQYLFRLQCFSNILTSDQEDVLRDNVESLPYPDDHSPETFAEYGGPQVFRLKGFGEPGSDDTWDEGAAGEIPSLRRREWTCWVAASRPKMDSWVKYDEHGKPLPVPDLIILEFELERDNYNPLTQPFDTYAESGTPDSFESMSRRESAAKPAGKSVGGASRSSKISNVRTTSYQSADRRSSSGLGVPVQPSATSEMRSGGQSEFPSGSTMPTSIQETGAASSKWAGTASTTSSTRRREGVEGLDIDPPLERVLESTTNYAKPLRSLVGMRRAGMDTWSETEGLSSNSSGDQSSVKKPFNARSRMSRGERSRRSKRRSGAASSSDALDVVTVLNQINEQLGRAPDLDSFLKITVGLVKDLCRFHRVIIYQFDEEYNGKVTTELVDWGTTTDLWKGLLFPASDIPPQARELYRINKVRFLYDRSQITARLVLRDKADLDTPLDMTHCFLRAMSPIHLQDLANMKVRSSMSISIMAFGKLWGLIACHSYGSHGMRVSFPVRQMLRLMSDVVSRNVERLQYAHRLRSRQLIDSPVTAFRAGSGSVNSADSAASQGYIVSNADELLSIFDADMGLLVINDGCKLLGRSEQAHSMLAIAEYLRIAKFETIVASSHITKDFPDLPLPRAVDTIAGLLYVPLTNEAGQDFIVLLRKGQVEEVKWAGRPYINEDAENKAVLEPRKSFKLWVQQVTGRSRPWDDDQIDSAKVLSLIYGKFIHVWRERQNASMTNELTAILLSNTSHAVRTPLSQIINTLELALAGNIDADTRNMLENSHQASRALLFHVHDLLDLTRIETGNETAFNDPFDIKETINTTVRLYQTETHRRGIAFVVTMADDLPPTVIGDARKIKTVISNLVANAVKYTRQGTIEVTCCLEQGAEQLPNSTSIQIIVSDTGSGIAPEKLEAMFVTLEGAVDRAEGGGVGLGLAVVARIVEQLQGQLRVESEVNKGTKFYFTCNMGVSPDYQQPHGRRTSIGASEMTKSPSIGPQSSSATAMASLDLVKLAKARGGATTPVARGGLLSSLPVSPAISLTKLPLTTPAPTLASTLAAVMTSAPTSPILPIHPIRSKVGPKGAPQLRILVVEDDVINSQILQKRLKMDKHTVRAVENGQEAVDLITSDWDFDAVVMDIQMPIMDGFESAREIRLLERGLVAAPEGIDPIRVDGRLPIFALSASLYENDRQHLGAHFDGWLLKPLNFKRLRALLEALLDPSKRAEEIYRPGQWERGGYFRDGTEKGSV